MLTSVRVIWRHKDLAVEMAKRDLLMLNKGALLGWAWVALLPLIQTLLYVVIVTFVFGSRVPGASGVFGYMTYVLGGMVAWQLLSRGLTQAPSLLRERMDVIKQVVYPIETIPLTAMLVSSMSAVVVLVLYLALAAWDGALHWTTLLFPLPLAMTFLFLIGASWVLSVAGVVLKDLRELVAVLLSAGVFLSPVTLRPSMVGESLWAWVMWNPLTHFVLIFRDVLQGEFHVNSWLIAAALTALVLWVGDWVIQRARPAINQLL
jgi:lipopolysaccharide transport system permease protein